MASDAKTRAPASPNKIQPQVWQYSGLEATPTVETPPKPSRLSVDGSPTDGIPAPQASTSPVRAISPVKRSTSPQKPPRAHTLNCSPSTCATKYAWKTTAKDAVVCLVHGDSGTAPDDLVMCLQGEVVRLLSALVDRDTEIERLRDQVSELEIKLDGAVTQTELLLAARSSDLGNERLNEIGDAVRRISLSQSASNSTPASLAADVAARVGSIKQTAEPEAQRSGSGISQIPSVPDLQRSGRSLDHATKNRVTPRSRPKSKPEALTIRPVSTVSTQSLPPGSSLRSPSPKSPLPKSPNVTVPSPTSVEPEAPPVDPAEEHRRKMASMGGVNPLAGMNPAAMMGQLKGRISRTQSSESIPAPVTSVEDGDEKDIRKWIFETLGEKDPSGELALVLKDGQILCRLMNTLRPATPIKINTGKFKFAAIENVNAYLRQAEQAFATPRMFEPAELQDGDCQRVLEHLAAIEKKNKA